MNFNKCAFLNEKTECVNAQYHTNKNECENCIYRPNAQRTLDEIDLCADCEHCAVVKYEFENKIVHIVGCKLYGCFNETSEKRLDNCIDCPNSETIRLNSERVNYTAIRCKNAKCWEQT